MLAVKLGAEGALACGPKGRVRCPARAVEAVDPVGAGDSFDAGFIHAYLRGADLAECLAQGNAAGAFSTTRPGGTEAFRDRMRICSSFSANREQGRTAMIDFHTHPVLIREFAEKYPDYTRMAREVFQIGNNLQPLETFFLQMDVAGIEKAVLLPIACARARGLAVSSNEQVAELCGLSKRFIGFASVDPLQPGAAKELEAAVHRHGAERPEAGRRPPGFRPERSQGV